MSLLITVLVTFFAGMGAGLGTGFAGMSAAAVISPMLITFLVWSLYGCGYCTFFRCSCQRLPLIHMEKIRILILRTESL